MFKRTFCAPVILALAVAATAQTPNTRTPGAEATAFAAGRETRLTQESLHGKQFRFSWKTERGSRHIGTATLRKDGTIAGIPSPNETFWLVDDEGRLVFKHRDGRVSTIFTRAEQREGRWFFSGPFQFREGVVHRLEEILAEVTTTSNDELINRAVRSYSKQRIVSLDPGEAYRFALGDGSTKTVRLVSVQEHRDRVVNMIRRAHVRVEIDGQPLDLVCAPYVMPT
jgi:hypothetical protein